MPGLQEIVPAPAGLPPAARAELAAALARLDAGPGPIVRAATALGQLASRTGAAALLRLGMRLPAAQPFDALARAALARAYAVAILGIESRPRLPAGPLVVAFGAAGGLAGFAGFLPDATLTTLLILREIARIARRHGENLADDAARHACLEVFAFPAAGAGAGAGYFSTRLALRGAPLAALIAQAASRYGLVLGEKLAAQAVPLAGAAAGATLNAAFLAHYRRQAEAHFTIRRLERAYGREVITAASRPVLAI